MLGSEVGVGSLSLVELVGADVVVGEQAGAAFRVAKIVGRLTEGLLCFRGVVLAQVEIGEVARAMRFLGSAATAAFI